MKMIRVAAAGAALACAVAVGCKRTQGERPPSPPVEVVVETVRPTTVPVEFEFLGQTEASRTVEVRARVQGFLVRQAAMDGQRVEAGETLYEIERSQFDADVAVARAKVDQAKARVEKAERDSARLARLIEADAGQQRALDDAKTEELQARAERSNAEAHLANAELQLSYTTIKSPVSGRIGISARREGALVDPGQNSYLNTVVQSDPIFVNFTISEREILKWREEVTTGKISIPKDGKLTIRLTLIDGSVYPHEGVMDFFDTAIDPATGTMRIRAEFKNPTERTHEKGEEREMLIPGQFVKARIMGWQRPNSVTVPQRAVLQTPNGPMVMVVRAEDKVGVQPVVLGGWHGDRWHVVKGLEAGERVVIDGVVKAHPGSVVKVVEAGVAERVGSN